MEAGSPKNDRSWMNGRPDARQPVSVLARREDFRLGSATILPSLRRVEGPQGQLTVEPLVMLVLVTFADSGGVVLTREDLMRSCWSGSVVGDDAINRAVAEVRRVARATGAGFGIETIPRIGYRLTQERPAVAGPETAAGPPGSEPPLVGEPPPAGLPSGTVPGVPVMTTRRWLLAGTLAAGAGVATAAWYRRAAPVDPQVAGLLEQGQIKVRWEQDDVVLEGIDLLQKAIGLEPDHAQAWGLLALGWAHAAESSVPGAHEACERAVRAARKLDSDEPNAAVADALIRRLEDSWFQTEQRLKKVIERHPRNTPAKAALATQLQSAGHTRQSSQLIDQILELDEAAGLSLPGTWTRRAIKNWLAGNNAESVQQAVNLLNHWPEHAYVRRSVLFLFAFNGEFELARSQVDKLPAGMARDWHLALRAFESGSPADHAAVKSQLPSGPIQDVHKTMILSQLNHMDEAYKVLLRYSRLEADQVVPAVEGNKSDHNPVWRRFQWVFCPAMRNLRSDERFGDWCRKVLMDKYWAERGEYPDEGLLFARPATSA